MQCRLHLDLDYNWPDGLEVYLSTYCKVATCTQGSSVEYKALALRSALESAHFPQVWVRMFLHSL